MSRSIHHFRRRWVALLLVATVLLASCSGQQASPTAAPLPPLKFGFDLWPGYYPVLIANGKGFFKDAGVAVEPIHPGQTDTMMADFTAGKYDAIAIALGDLVSLTQSNTDFSIVLISDESSGGDAIISLSGAQSITDLRGKRVGVNLGGFAELLVTTMLAENGMTPADVILVDMDAAELPAKLASGEVEAGHTWEPYLTQIVDAGGTVLFSSAQTPGLIPDAIAFRGDVIRQRPDDVRAFVKAWGRAADFWLDNREEGTAIAAAALQLPPESISLKGIRLLTLADNQALFQPGQTTASLEYTTKLYIDFYTRIGTIRTPPDTKALLNSSFLN
jgi:NitT/TauT family transport system substrate-binding protein